MHSLQCFRLRCLLTAHGRHIQQKHSANAKCHGVWFVAIQDIGPSDHALSERFLKDFRLGAVTIQSLGESSRG